MLAELDPVGAMEAILAERIVSLTWRLKRAARMQDEVLDVKIRLEINSSKPWLSKSLITGQPCRLSKNTKRCYDDLALGLIAKWDFEDDRVLERLSMYERRFEASLFRTMAELKKLQQARKREQAKAETVGPTIPKASGFEAATHRGRDAHETQGQDALATGRETQGQDALATECAKQSQSAGGENELSAFEKKEYELLLSAEPRPNKANDPQQRTENRGQKTDDRGRKAENRLRRQAGICRY